MNKLVKLLSLCFVVLAWSCSPSVDTVKVSNADELNAAITNAVPGQHIVMANGVWTDVEIEFDAKGTEQQRIFLEAETAGQVFIEGQSSLKFGGEYLTVDGLFFRNGYAPGKALVEFRIGKEKIARYCRFTNSVIVDFNKPQRDTQDFWVLFRGRYNQMDKCYIAGKSNQGPTVRVAIQGNKSIKNYHKIVNNHFGPRPRKGGPKGETLQLGDSETSVSPSNTTVANNFFERCNGEVEIISSKTNNNIFRNNVFFKSEGSVVMRHGNYCLIDGNYFIGDDNSSQIGGIRIINTGHWITNNYFYNLKGTEFRSPLAIMNGIPKSPLNRYNQVTDIVVAHNSWVECKTPIAVSVGTNISQKDVLPKSEIRSARPKRSVFANNIIYNKEGDNEPIKAYEKIDGIKFDQNVIDNKGVDYQNYSGLENKTMSMKKVAEYIYAPQNALDTKPYQGFDFETIAKDIFGNDRNDANNSIGAIIPSKAIDPNILDKSKYGPSWYSDAKPEVKAELIELSAGDNLNEAIAKAADGDILSLSAGEYAVTNSLLINKKVSIQSKEGSNPAQIVYSGSADSPLFEMNPKGDIVLNNVKLKGTSTQYAFAPLAKGMSNLYNIKVADSEIENFNFVIKAYKESMSDEITFTNSTLKNCANGLELSAEKNDKGDYNVAFLTIDNCEFDNIDSNVIDYYRGGYDESTIGGTLKVSNSTFTNSGDKEENGILLNTRGIINVDIANNTFTNNKVKLVALLWGAKNNTHSDNKISNSGKIVVQQNLKLKLVY